MKPGRWMGVIGILAVALLLAGCGSASDAQGAAVAAELAEDAEATVSRLDLSYEGALSLRNQLALGTLRLEDTDWPVTEAQSADLLLLWQALRGTMGSAASAEAEVDALLAQIESTMSGGQLAAINAMHLTQTDLQGWAQSQGLGTGEGAGAGSGQPGSGQSLSPEERATRQAERQASGGATGSGTSQALIDAVIALLAAR